MTSKAAQRYGVSVCVLSAGAEDKASEEGERERDKRDSGDEQLEKCRGEWRGDRGTKKGNGEVQRPQ